MKIRRAPQGYWNLERAIKVAQDCKYRTELLRKHQRAWELLKEAGLLDTYFFEKKEPPKREKIWTVKKSLTVVPLCNSRFQLRMEHPGAYITLRDEGLLAKYFPTKWVRPFTKEERVSIIASCKTRSELHHKQSF